MEIIFLKMTAHAQTIEFQTFSILPFSHYWTGNKFQNKKRR